MRCMRYFIAILLILGLAFAAKAQDMPGSKDAPADTGPKPVEVTADDSLEWYQDQQIYVARGNAKAVRGDMVVEADILTAHERDKPKTADGQKAPKVKPKVDDKTKSSESGSGDIDKMTAEGHVRITDPKQRVTGDHAVYDLDKHAILVTGNNLRYETEKDTVTAKDSLEYYEDTKIAVARGNAVADKGDRHVQGDVLTSEFRDMPNGTSEMQKMTAIGHVIVITKADVSKGDKGVYDVPRDIAVLTGNVHITRADGTQLSGDVGEVDFKTNQSRLMNSGTGRVRALLTSKTTNKATTAKTKAGTTPAANTPETVAE